jgi:hypothetical protein
MRKVGLIHPIHLVADLLNAYTKKGKVMPNEGMRALTTIAKKIFRGDAAKMAALMTQFQEYWSEVFPPVPASLLPHTTLGVRVQALPRTVRAEDGGRERRRCGV